MSLQLSWEQFVDNRNTTQRVASVSDSHLHTAFLERK